MTLFEKSCITLELPRVLEMLSAMASSEAAKDNCLRLSPATERGEVERRLEETDAAKKLLAYKGSPSFTHLKDVRGAAARADMGGLLNTRELLDIAALLSTARSVRSYGLSAEEHSCIDHLFATLQVNRFLEEKITTSILSEDEIADNASPELADIRRKIRAASARVRDALQKIISSPSMQKMLQDSIITTRSDRFVVPVKSEYKGSVPGLVHDVSASGATLFVEPMAAVKANNEIRELKAKEKAEIERILFELSAECAAHREDIDTDCAVLITLDGIFARGRLSDAMDGCSPLLSDREIHLRRARHPLLPKDTAVPIDVELGNGYDSLIITGPNTGGKTVTLKTIGLLILMTQCGLHIPVGEGSSLPVLENVLADIGDEQSIEQSLSTFSAHMRTIVQILEDCGERSLLLFDELGAGTDPTEGAALAIAILEKSRSLGSLIAATTHYSELKVYATNTAGVMNASCEFDVETLRPTYRLLLGIPGKSNAFAISRRLGLGEDIIEDAQTRVGVSSAKFEETIEKLEQARRLLDQDRMEEARLRRAAEEEAKKSARLRAELEVRLDKAQEKAKREAERILADARQVAETTFQELSRIKEESVSGGDHKKNNEARAEVLRQLNEARSSLRSVREAEENRVSSRAVKVGDVVEVKAMGGARATVEEISADRVLKLRSGILSLTAKEDEVILLDNVKPQRPAVSSGMKVALRTESTSSELDIRGMETIEAIPVVERYIDASVQAGLESVRIIHGKGTGALRTAVQQCLKKMKQVKSYRLGRYGEGETGVTVVELK